MKNEPFPLDIGERSYRSEDPATDFVIIPLNRLVRFEWLAVGGSTMGRLKPSIYSADVPGLRGQSLVEFAGCCHWFCCWCWASLR